MNYLRLSIILTIILTIIIGILKPNLPKRAIITDANVQIIDVQDTQTSQPNFQQHKQAISNTENIAPIKPQTTQYQPPKSYYQPQKSSAHKNTPNVVSNNFAPIKLEQEAPNKRTLSQEEIETICWNKWRSDLNNKIAHDVNFGGAPLGTKFLYSFTVDREGTISNLKVWSSNSSYTPFATREMKPVILSYQGKSILNFPTESKRVITNVYGGIFIGYKDEDVSPSAYSDYEKIKH